MRHRAWLNIAVGLACSWACREASAAGSDSGAISQRLPPDARSRGMGDAFTALAEGPSAVWWNPAALGTGPELAVAPVGYSHLLPGLADQVTIYSFSAAGRRSAAGAGLNLNVLTYGEDDLLPGSTAFHETTWHLGAGVDFIRLWMPAETRFELAAGTALKRMSAHSIEAILNGSPDEAASAWDMDFGVLGTLRLPLGSPADSLRPSAFVLRAGSVLGNAFDQELEFANQTTLPAGQTVRSGAALGFDLFDKRAYGYVLCVRAAADLTSFHGKAGGGDDVTHVGFEATFFELFSARTGFADSKDDTVEDWSYGLGFGRTFPEALGLRAFGFQVDWAQIPQPATYKPPSHFSLAAHCKF